MKYEQQNLTAPSDLQRAVEARPAVALPEAPVSSRLEGDNKAREKAEEEERLWWAGEVAEPRRNAQTRRPTRNSQQ